MKGYVSFLLASVSLLLLLSLIELRASSYGLDLSRAIAIERAYGDGMNVKEAILESVREGARAGFGSYDSSHDLEACLHCPDNFCSPPLPPAPPVPNACDAARCASCFRESEARAAAEAGAEAMASSLAFPDGDFTSSPGKAEVEALLRHDGQGKNGFALDYAIFEEPLRITLSSERFGMSASSSIPRGMVVR
jgi:hypothetical protein